MGVLTAVLIFAAGVIVGFTIAAVTETRVERKLDKKFWADEGRDRADLLKG